MENQQIDLDLLSPAIPRERTIPNKFPTINTEHRLAIIGEAPGAQEMTAGEPFVGPSGRLLDGLLSRNNILRSSCFIGNICQHRPPNNDISSFDWDGEEMQDGITKLKEDLAVYKPNMLLALGGSALHALCGDARSVMTYRGSLFWCDWGYKAMASYHPAYCLRAADGVPLLNLDLKRVSLERQSPELSLPIRQFDLGLTSYEIVDRLACMQHSGLEVSIDIEGYVHSMPCLSFTTDPLGGIIVPFEREQGKNHWETADDEARVWMAVKAILEDPLCPKVLQNGMYDRFVLYWSHGILIRNMKHDTMLMHWEKYCELPKNLGLLASIYTKEPYYKGDRKAQDVKTFQTYCCKDSAVTLEIRQRLLPTLQASELAHYDFNKALQDSMLYMQTRGMKFNQPLVNEKKEKLGLEIDLLNTQLEIAAGQKLNVKSVKQKKEFLYEKLGLPKQYKRGTESVTTNYEAMLSLYKKTNNEAVGLIISITSLRTRLSALGMGIDSDGRIRCSYNIVGTETGRLSCSTSITGSGTNLQTIQEIDRDLFEADEGKEMFQCDLSGADTYTVAAHCNRLGDKRMVEDLAYGLKVAKVLTLALKEGASVISLPASQLLELCKNIPKDDPLYFGSKCCVHGSNYGMGKVLMSQTIFIQSEGKVNLPSATCEKLQQLYFRRYPGVLSWHRWVASELRNKRQLVQASGHTRRFFGNPNDHGTLKAALADEPQGNTTYATNLAALNLWLDPENKHPDGSLIIEPLHQVHDALVGQWPIELRDWAKAKVRSYFQNTLTIAGQPIIIPFSGQFGANWYEAGDEKNLNVI